jgi:hypothetical protein
MATKRATDDALGSLHEKLAATLADGLKWRDPATGLPNAALLSIARQLLKDNKIESTAPAGSPLRTLADLPVFEDDGYETAGPAAH